MSDPKRVVKLAKMFQEVLDVAKDLDKISDLEQAKRNAEAVTVAARHAMKMAVSDSDAAHERLVEAQDDLKVAEKRAEETVPLAKQAAQKIITDAKEEAEVVVRTALEQGAPGGRSRARGPGAARRQHERVCRGRRGWRGPRWTPSKQSLMICGNVLVRSSF